MPFRQLITREFKQWGLAALIVLLTLSATMQWTPAREQKPVDSQEEKAAATKLYQHVREARATWRDFPGFTADVAVCYNGQCTTGKLVADKEFNVKLTLNDQALSEWSLPKLRSVIGHRKYRQQKPIPATFADQEVNHPLGRLVNIDGKNVSFRLQGDVMTEVHRRSDKSWFTISTLDVWRTRENEVLPQVTSVTYRDPQSGAILSNLSNTFGFKRVGKFDLPASMLTVECGEKFDRNVGSIKLSNHRLLTDSSLSQTETN
ncbi:DUF3386 family protein [Gimesia panareensis]|uniref:DUF3386 family protein n=1 Tax=Gimesia panareensis TaxID=2527978 RepID=UPI00118D4457|nr:DUF3386 family protein [Gimesia panareensis]QDU50184.1 hypothetical protein Pan110_25270 [Gimesia panareensis]